MKGFVDLQVNGFAGVDFSAPDLTLDQVRLVVETLSKKGTLAFCPTVITSPMEVYEHNLPVLARALAEPDLCAHLLGIHLEGPFISAREGARGAHSPQFVVPPDIGVFDRLQELCENGICLLTLAPERPGARELIEYASARGVVVCLGHHLAGREAIQNSCQWGAVASTHLGNGIPNQLPRHPNPLWDQLAERALTSLLITDGHHLDESFLRVAIQVKGPDKVIVVSDSAPIAGLPPGSYRTLGQRVVLKPSGRLHNPVENHLVGSSRCLLECLNYLAGLRILSESELWQVGYSNPLRLLGKSLRAKSSPGLPEVLYRDGTFRLEPSPSTSKREIE